VIDIEELERKINNFMHYFLYWVLMIGTAIGAVGVLRLVGILP
jgi:hypothetical protein